MRYANTKSLIASVAVLVCWGQWVSVARGAPTRRAARKAPARRVARAGAAVRPKVKPAKAGARRVAKARTRRFRFRFSAPLSKGLRNFSLKGLASLRFKKPGARAASGSRGQLGRLLPIAKVETLLKTELATGRTLPGDPWLEELKRWKDTPAAKRSKYPPGDLRRDEAAAQVCRQKPDAKPNECISSYDRFEQGYQAILIPDLQRYVPFIFKVVFNRPRYSPKDQKETVWLLYQYGCRQISRLMPGFAKIVRRVISTEVDLVSDWSEPISKEGLKKALGPNPKDTKNKGGERRPKAGAYKPKKEIIEICTVTHRQLEETLKKDLRLIVQANWRRRRAPSRTYTIVPISGPVYDASMLKRIASTIKGSKLGGTNAISAMAAMTYERNSDRYGGDYNSFVTADRSATSCLTRCFEEPRCKAFTFHAASRRCYLKSRAGPARRKPGYYSGIRKPPSAAARRPSAAKKVKPGFSLSLRGLRKPARSATRIQVYRDSDHWGGDYRSFLSKGMSDCQTHCARDPRCKAFTFQRATKRCWLKSKAIRRLRKPGYDTGVKKQSGKRSSLTPRGRRAAMAPCAADPKITILKASLGKRCGQREHNFTLKLSAACNGKKSCRYRTPRQRKRGRCAWSLAVEYHCGDRKTRTAHVPGDAWARPPLNISCAGVKLPERNLAALRMRHKARNVKITVIQASVGHNCHGAKHHGNMTRKLANACNGKRRCTFKVPKIKKRSNDYCTWAFDASYHCGDGKKKQAPHIPGDAWDKGPTVLDCTGESQFASAAVKDAVRRWKKAKGWKKLLPQQRQVHQNLYTDMGRYEKKLKGETFHDVAKRLLTFYRKTGSARNFEFAIRATKKNSIQKLAKNVKSQAPAPAKAKKGEVGALEDATKEKSVEKRTRRERLRRKVEQWTYGYEYDQLKPVIKSKAAILGQYRSAEKVVLQDFWNDCEEVRSICENPRTPTEKHACFKCAERALYTECVDGKDKNGRCKGETTVRLVDLERAVDGLKTRGNWKEYASKLSTKDRPGGNTFLNWLELKLIQEVVNPNLIRGDDGKSPTEVVRRATRHLVARIFLSKKVDEEKEISNEGRQQLDALPVTTWQRCVLFNPQWKPGNGACDGKKASLDRFKGRWNTLDWQQALLFRTALKGAGVKLFVSRVNQFWKKRCSNPDWKGHCNVRTGWAKYGRDAADALFRAAGGGGGFDRNGRMRDAGDAIGNTLGPVIGKLLGFLLKAGGMYEMMKTLAKAAGLTPEQSIDCEDPEYRHDVLQITPCEAKPCGAKGLRPGEKCLKAGEKVSKVCQMDTKRGCLLKVFAKNFTNVLESIIVMLGNKLVDWGVDLLRTALQPVKSAIITAAGSVPFVGGVLATLVDIAWELLMNFGAKMLLKSFVVAKLPEWLQIRKMAKLPVDKLFEEPIVAAVIGIILQLIQSAVDYGDKSIANVAVATVIGSIQEALYAAKDEKGKPPMFWIRALLYAKREFVKENISSNDPGEVVREIGIGMIKGFAAAIERRITDDKTKGNFKESVTKMTEYLRKSDLIQKLMSQPIEELTRIIGQYVGPIVVPIVTTFVPMPAWAKGMLNTFADHLSTTIEELLPPRNGRARRTAGTVNGLKILGRVVDVLKPAGEELLNTLNIDEDLKDMLTTAYGGLTKVLGSAEIEHLEERYFKKPWAIVEGVVNTTGPFISKKLGDLIQDASLEPEKNLITNTLDMAFGVLGNQQKREKIFPPGGNFRFSELLKALAGPLGTYATERLGKLAAGSGLEGLVALLVDEVFGPQGPFFHGASYFEGENLVRRLANRGPEIASQAMDAVAGLVVEKGLGGPILGSLVTGVAKALRKAVQRRPESPAQVIGLVVEAFSPVVDTLVAEIPGGGSNQPLGKILRPVLRKVLGFFGTPANLTRLSQGPQALAGLARDIGAGLADGLKAILGDLVREAGDAALKPVTDQAIESLFRMLSDPARLQRLQGDAVLELVKDIGGALLRYVGGKVSGAVGRGQPAAVKTAIVALVNGVVGEITQIVGDPTKMRALVTGGAAGVAALVARVVRGPLGSFIDARLPQAARAPVKTAMGELFTIVGDPRKLRELGVMRVTALLGKLAPVIKQLLLGIFTQAVPAAKLAPIRTALDKLGTGLANPGAATDETRTAIGQTVWGAVLRIKNERLRGLATNLVSLARDLVATSGAQLRGDAKQILRRLGDAAVRFAEAILPPSPIRELVSAMLESVSGLFRYPGGLQRAFVQPAQDVLRPITRSFSRLMRDVLRRAIPNGAVATLASGLLDEVLGFFGHADRWRQLRENGVGFVFSRLIPIGRDFTIAMLARSKGTGNQILKNVVRSLFTFAAGMFRGGQEAMRNFGRNAVSALISMGVGALKPVIVGFIRQSTRSEPFAKFIDEAMTELSNVLSNPQQLQSLLGGRPEQAFDKLLAKAKGMVKRLIGGVLRDPILRKLAEEGLDAVLEFAKKAVRGRDLGAAAKGILVKVLPAFVDFAKAKLVRLIPNTLRPVKRLANKWFDRIKKFVTLLLNNPRQLEGELKKLLGRAIGDVLDTVREPLEKVISWQPLRDLLSNLMKQVAKMLEDPAKMIAAFNGRWKKAMAYLLPKLDKVVGQFAEDVFVNQIPGSNIGKDILRGIVQGARGLLQKPREKLFKYIEAKDGKDVLKCFLGDVTDVLVEQVPGGLKEILKKGIQMLIDEQLLKGARCPVARSH